MKNECPALIECGDHKFAPWAVICIHLMTGESREWIPVPLGEDDNREIDSDWICPQCDGEWEEFGEEGLSENLRPACIHCVRELRKKYDPNFVEEE